ncbi:MAG: hypothetical protein ACREDK_00980 [Thermoplasmata archaeon]
MIESEMAVPVRQHLEAQGYTVWVDPDGTDYFDMVARRGSEVGLVELKVSDARKVLGQAVRRRGFGDWVAVVLPRESTARRVLALPVPAPGARVGVWWLEGGTVRVARAAIARPVDSDDPFADRRRALVEMLDHLEAGRLPLGVAWSHLTHGRARPRREVRLDEFPDLSPPAERSD